MSGSIKVALVGNPNTGKTSLFNQLTGLNQKTGNYPGITVQKKIGQTKLSNGTKVKVIDLPGTYSLNSTSVDEAIVGETLLGEDHKDFPDVSIVVADVENLKRNLLLFTQVKDLGLPAILAINMSDQMDSQGIKINLAELEKGLDSKVALISSRTGEGVGKLKNLIESYREISTKPLIDLSRIYPKNGLNGNPPSKNGHGYKDWLEKNLDHFNTEKAISNDTKRLQHKEAALRYQFINGILDRSYQLDPLEKRGIQAKIDRILTHKVWGYLIFVALLLLIFQAIYDWSGYPQDLIDGLFANLGSWTKTVLPSGMLTDLLAEGIIAGIGGIVIFIPQIAFLFLIISILEESGYMSRVVFLMDKIMRPFGLSGKSVVPLISGTACAIPAVMASRTIENWKERLLTILVVPFTTCSARLPVYLILIALVIPEQKLFGFGYQALTLFALYFLGFAIALLSAIVLKRFFKSNVKSHFIAEMPNYRWPLPKNVLLNVWEKTKSFVLGAGQIILAISVVLWFLGSFGFSDEFKNAEQLVDQRIQESGLNQYSHNYIDANLELYRSSLKDGEGKVNMASVKDSVALYRNSLVEEAREQEIASFKLEHSFIGQAGKAIEPLVRPLGYDWKIGIALITSFAAREVFVGTLATIYSVGSDEEETIKNRMAAELDPEQKRPLFNLATGVSLMIFYALAMQCMSTLAIVKRETNSWKWPILQLIGMTGLAYIASFIVYQLLS